MNVTVGELVDRLSIVNVKLFQEQQKVIDRAHMSAEDFAGITVLQLHADNQKLHALNAERNRLIAALNERFGEATGSTIKLS